MRILISLLLALCSVPVSRGHNIAHTTPEDLRRDLAGVAASPTSPQLSLKGVMSSKGCKLFADLIAGDVENTFDGNVGSGLTVFCPSDAAVAAFRPKFKNLTADAKSSLLLYHGDPVYNSLSMLKSGNGVVNTLATDGTAKNYNFTVQNAGEAVTLATGVVTATITGTVVDRDPLAVYTIDAVLEPKELFKPAEAPAPAPAPESDAPAPVEEADATSPPAPAPEGKKKKVKAADQKGNAGAGGCGGPWAAAIGAAAAAGILMWG